MATLRKSADAPVKTQTAAPRPAKVEKVQKAASPVGDADVPAKPDSASRSRRKASAGIGAAKLAVPTPEQRRCYVEVAAYYIAEQRGFSDGNPLDDWVEAEAQVDRLLRDGILKP